jgi:hypothetical protein
MAMTGIAGTTIVGTIAGTTSAIPNVGTSTTTILGVTNNALANTTIIIGTNPARVAIGGNPLTGKFL